MIKQPSAFVPVAMSLTALALVIVKVLGDVATQGAVVHEADEGGAAHLWQLLMAGQVPVLAFFAIKWLPVSDHRKTWLFERRADRYRRGMAGNGSIQRLCRPQIVHWHTVGGWGGAGGVIAAAP